MSGKHEKEGASPEAPDFAAQASSVIHVERRYGATVIEARPGNGEPTGIVVFDTELDGLIEALQKMRERKQP